MEITAKVVTVLPAEDFTTKSGKVWQKRNFILQTEEQYKKLICFQLFGDKVNDCPSVGEVVKVSFDIESREWNGKWFTQLNAWKVERCGSTQPVSQQGWESAYPQPSPQPQYVQPTPPQVQGDDLPF